MESENGANEERVQVRQVEGLYTLEVGSHRFRIPTEVVADYVATSKANGGWGHVGVHLVHPAGAVIAPLFEEVDGDPDVEVEILEVDVTQEDHSAAATLFDRLFD